MFKAISTKVTVETVTIAEFETADELEAYVVAYLTRDGDRDLDGDDDAILANLNEWSFSDSKENYFEVVGWDEYYPYYDIELGIERTTTEGDTQNA